MVESVSFLREPSRWEGEYMKKVLLVCILGLPSYQPLFPCIHKTTLKYLQKKLEALALHVENGNVGSQENIICAAVLDDFFDTCAVACDACKRIAHRRSAISINKIYRYFGIAVDH
jgi:hypothetical protein